MSCRRSRPTRVKFNNTTGLNVTIGNSGRVPSPLGFYSRPRVQARSLLVYAFLIRKLTRKVLQYSSDFTTHIGVARTNKTRAEIRYRYIRMDGEKEIYKAFDSSAFMIRVQRNEGRILHSPRGRPANALPTFDDCSD